MFQVVRYSPVYCQITDGQTGVAARRLPMTYALEALAYKIAGRLEEEDREHCGDDIFGVVPVGGDVWRRTFPRLDRVEIDDECPF